MSIYLSLSLCVSFSLSLLLCPDLMCRSLSHSLLLCTDLWTSKGTSRCADTKIILKKILGEEGCGNTNYQNYHTPFPTKTWKDWSRGKIQDFHYIFQKKITCINLSLFVSFSFFYCVLTWCADHSPTLSY